MDWKDYEIYITRHFRRLFPSASIRHNVKRIGLISGTSRQIDMLIEQRIAGFDLAIVVDCKYFNKNVDITTVESFLGFLRDLKASKGVLITNRGYSEAAEKRASQDSQDIDLRVINFNDLEEFQNFIAIPYQHADGAIVSAPPGWIIDDSTIPGQFLASLYPAGLSREEAFHTEGFMYVNIWNRHLLEPTIEDLLGIQRANFEQTDDNVRIEMIPTIEREDCRCVMRMTQTAKLDKAKTLEMTLFLEWPDAIIFVVLLTTGDNLSSYREKLEWVGQKLVKVKMVLNSAGLPIDSKLIY